MGVGGSKTIGLFPSTNVIHYQNLVTIGQRGFELFLKNQKSCMGGGGGGGGRKLKNNGALPIHQCDIPPKFGNNRSTPF